MSATQARGRGDDVSPHPRSSDRSPTGRIAGAAGQRDRCKMPGALGFDWWSAVAELVAAPFDDGHKRKPVGVDSRVGVLEHEHRQGKPAARGFRRLCVRPVDAFSLECITDVAGVLDCCRRRHGPIKSAAYGTRRAAGPQKQHRPHGYPDGRAAPLTPLRQALSHALRAPPCARPDRCQRLARFHHILGVEEGGTGY